MHGHISFVCVSDDSLKDVDAGSTLGCVRGTVGDLGTIQLQSRRKKKTTYTQRVDTITGDIYSLCDENYDALYKFNEKFVNTPAKAVYRCFHKGMGNP